MAKGYETLTISGTPDSPAEFLRLNSPFAGSLEGGLEYWGQPGAGISGSKMDIGMDMGIGMKIPGEINAFDQEMTFGGDGGLLESMTNLPFTPSYDLDAFSTFEDPFSYQSGPFSTLETSIPELNPSNPNPDSTESKDEKPDNKLLSFKAPISNYAMFTSGGTQTWPSMAAELYGMFFVAEDVFGDNVATPGRPIELTCYRRNLFQISGNITMSRNIKSAISEKGLQLPVYEFSASLTAVESIEGKSTEIISIPWKSASQTASGSLLEEKSGNAPQRIPLDLSSSPELDPVTVSIPIAWKRLQFKHATANNGRRKGLQQHYVVHISLAGVFGNGETVKLAEIHSGPIIVRGRSPRNFDSRKDVSLSADRKIENKPKPSDFTKEPPQRVDPGVSNGSYKFYAMSTQQTPLDLSDWNTPTPAPIAPIPSSSLFSDNRRTKKPSLTHASSSSSILQRTPVPRARWNSDSAPPKPNSLNTSTQQHHQRATPIDLSILEEEQSVRGQSGSGVRSLSLGEESPRFERMGSGNPAIVEGSVGKGPKKAIGSPIENADLLYEYFPLSLDDWMPPVDAIYRPHVVHHTIVPPDLKAEQVKNKTKRYFSADE